METYRHSPAEPLPPLWKLYGFLLAAALGALFFAIYRLGSWSWSKVRKGARS